MITSTWYNICCIWFVGIRIPYVGKFWSGKKLVNWTNRMPLTNFLHSNYFFLQSVVAIRAAQLELQDYGQSHSTCNSNCMLTILYFTIQS